MECPEVLDFRRSGRETDFFGGDLDLWRLRRLERPLLGETELWTGGLSAGAASSLTVHLGTGAGAGSVAETGVGSGSLLVFRVELEL